jgi:lysophospholipase L1-like esterase
MLSQDGKPAVGQLMFQPSRIISVRDSGLETNYTQGADYTVTGRTLVCTRSSRMPWLRDQDLLKGEFKWNTFGGKQIMVTYEHDDTWNHPRPAFLGHKFPNTMKKLRAHAPLTIVAYGDSITHGVGASRLCHIPPFLPPWPELFVRQLKSLSHDEHLRFYNSAQSGATSKWAKEYAGRMVGSLAPDLVLITFGQNDFWSISANSFASNIADTLKTIRDNKPDCEFLLVSTLRFDPSYTTNSQYWNVVGEYSTKLQDMTATGIQFVDLTTVSEWVYAAKKPKDCLNDPLHPNDYLARWYAQCLAAAFDPGLAQKSPAILFRNEKQTEWRGLQ